MDKNITSFIREDAKTIGVRFFQDSRPEAYDSRKNTLLSLGIDGQGYNLSAKEYTYVTMESFKVGEFAIVIVNDIPKVVVVTRVDDDLEISPNDSTQYKWIVSKVSLDNYHKIMEENKEITKTLSISYMRNMKRSFAAILLANVDQDAQDRIKAITSPKVVKEEEEK